MSRAGSLQGTSAAELLSYLRESFGIFHPGSKLDIELVVNVIDHWEKQHAAKEVQATVQQMQLEDAQEVHLKLTSMLIEKGSAYTNLVIVAGYASFFALMPLVKDLLSTDQRRWSALLMLISLAAFAGFEVFKMLFMQFAMIKRLDNYNKEARKPSFDFIAESKKLQTDLQRLQTRFIPIWVAMVTVSVLAGVAAIAIPTLAFIIETAS